MIIDLVQLTTSTIAGILLQLPIFFLIIWGVRIIAREMPKWLKTYHENQIKEIMLQRAVNKDWHTQ